MTTADPAGTETLRSEAARWFARMRGPGSEASRAEFEAWLSSDPLHREAYSSAAEIFAMGKLLAEPGADVRRSGRRGTRVRGRLALAAVAAALLAAIACWPVVRKSLPNQDDGPRSAQQERGPGARAGQWSAGSEERSIRLADGSLVRLESATAIAARLTAAERILTVERGSARFFVAHEERPFVVHAGGGSVTARGTVFDVALTARRLVTVRLLSGVVDVSVPDAGRGSHPSPRRLHPGQSLSFAAAAGSPGVDAAGSGAGAARPDATGKAALDYDSVALADLVRLANRGSGRPIRLADPATAKLRVSGKFAIGDTGLLADRLALLFGLAEDLHDRRVIVLGRVKGTGG